MKFVLGSGSERKLKITKKIIKQVTGVVQTEIISYPAQSQVSETPWNDQTPQGAKNRAIDSKNNIPDSDYWIGLESGLAERFGHVFEEAWCCIINKDGKEYYGYSSGLKVPDYILGKMKAEGLEHCQVMKILEEEYHLPQQRYLGKLFRKQNY